MIDKSEFKPCPFCQKSRCQTIHQYHPRDLCVFCINCGAEGPKGSTRQEAIEFWNKREGGSIMIDKSKLKPFDAEAYKRGVPAVVRFYDDLYRALEVSEKIDVVGDHTVLISDGGELCWLFVTEDDLFMLDVRSEQEIPPLPDFARTPAQRSHDGFILPQASCSQSPITGLPSIDWEQRRWEMYIAVITDAMRWQEYEDIDTSFCMKHANEYTDAFHKEMSNEL